MARPYADVIAGNHARSKDEADYYPTPPWATNALIQFLASQGHKFGGKTCWEPAAGGGHMVDVLTNWFAEVYATDIADPDNRGWDRVDFLSHGIPMANYDWAITNPPFKHTDKFVLEMMKVAYNVAVLCRLQWLESKGRYERLWRDTPPSDVLVFSERLHMMKNKIPKGAEGGSAIAYAWYVWDSAKLTRETNPTQLHWIPPRGSQHKLL